MKKKEEATAPQTLAVDSYTKTTRNIQITVIPSYIEEQSDPKEGIYSFSYKVFIRNLGAEGVELVNRHWRVFSYEEQIADVKGEGVGGEQPLLEPGDEFIYSSWTTITAPYGSMQGQYTFISESGEFFDVEVPRFDLRYFDPHTLH